MKTNQAHNARGSHRRALLLLGLPNFLTSTPSHLPERLTLDNALRIKRVLY